MHAAHYTPRSKGTDPAITPIVGVSSVAHLAEAVEATRFTLPEEALEELNTVG